MVLRLRRFDSNRYELSVFTDGLACILAKEVQEDEFKRAFEYYCNSEFSILELDDDGCSDELYDVFISNGAISI